MNAALVCNQMILNCSHLPFTMPRKPLHPSFRKKCVMKLNCRFCGNCVCMRGMKAILLADNSVELFSTDEPASLWVNACLLFICIILCNTGAIVTCFFKVIWLDLNSVYLKFNIFGESIDMKPKITCVITKILIAACSIYFWLNNGQSSKSSRTHWL